MIHAFLITAYRDVNALEQLIDQLMLIRDCRIYINIDRRSTDLVRRVSKFADTKAGVRIHVRSDLRVRWGSIYHLDAFMILAQKALQDGCEFFHTMTGQCRIVRSIPEFEAFFQERRSSNFLEHFPLPTKIWPGGGLDRIRYFQLFDVLDAKRHPFHSINGLVVRLQRMIGVNRLDSGTRYFGGSTYYSINRTAMEYLLHEYLKQRKRYRHTFCSEEVAPHTILCNAPAGLRDSLVNNNLRFVLWRRKHGETPGILDLEDRAEISAQEYYFARKFDSAISSTLARSLDGAPTVYP
jgi:hypothetical protein